MLAHSHPHPYSHSHRSHSLTSAPLSLHIAPFAPNLFGSMHSFPAFAVTVAASFFLGLCYANMQRTDRLSDRIGAIARAESRIDDCISRCGDREPINDNSESRINKINERNE